MNFEMMFSPTDCARHSQSLLTGPIRQIIVTKLGECKTRLLEEFRAESQTFPDLVKSAVTEAEALAWSTPYPHLFLLALAEEKIACVQQWARRQHRIASRVCARQEHDRTHTVGSTPRQNLDSP